MDEYLILTQQYDTLCSQFDLKPDMIIYLRSDPVTAYERMVSRGRLEESSAKFNYIKGGFQLEFVSKSPVINHMTGYNSRALIGCNYSIETGEQIL